MQHLLQFDVRKIHTISEVTQDIRSLLEDNFQALWLCGEVSNFKASAAGHFYFTLKDQKAQMRAVMFKGSNRLLKFQIEDGQELILHGRITVYESRGEYQILVDHAEPKGVGALQLAFEQLKKRLEQEGLFDQKHKKALPFLPTCIGIVTSSKGAVLHDMLQILKRRFSNVNIVFCPVAVQGDGSAIEIAQAITLINQRSDIDVLIVGRGGGSLEDLWAFNEEAVVRAVFASKIPVISAVGHETDYTLCDLVADLRAPTPSAAAELVIPEKIDLINLVYERKILLQQAFQRYLKNLRESVAYYKRGFRDPRQYYANLKIRLDDLQQRLIQSQRFLMQGFHHRLGTGTHRLTDLSPLGLLKKGYSLIFKKEKQTPLNSVQNIEKGEDLVVYLSDGTVKVKVI